LENERLLKTEIANALSHGIGVILTLAFAPLLVSMAANSEIKNLGLGTAAYCLGLLMVFSFSTLYHAVFNPIAKRALRVFDHISIFFLIGGSYIPFIILYTDAPTARLFFIVQWSLIFLGIIKKVFYTGSFRLLSSLIYIFIGCMIFFFDRGFWGRIPDVPFYFIVAGGMSYLVGVVFYQNQKIPYNHFIWHLFVLFAAIFHFVAVYLVITS
jgi:hemolysin III